MTGVQEVSHDQLSIGDFLESYNQNIPASFPPASVELLEQFKAANANLFKHNNFWSLYVHRKKVIDWLLRNGATS